MDITPQPPAPATPSRGARYARAGALVAAGALTATALTGIAFGAATGSGSPAVPAAYGMGGYGMGPGGAGPGMGGYGMGPGGMGPGAMGDRDGDGPRSMGRMGGMHGRLGLEGPLLHGEGVAKDDSGAFVTVRMQTGTVVSASASQVVVKSEDGLSWTWPVGSATTVERDGATVKADALVAGDRVRAVGTVKDGVVTTKDIHALSAAKAAELDAKRKAWEQQRQQRQGGTTAPTPSKTA